MKTGASILSLILILLTVQPAFTRWDKTNAVKKCAVKKECCPSKKAPVKKNGQQDGCNTCNPFMACNACGYLVVDPEELLFPGAAVDDARMDYKTDDLSSYHSEYWHPPELFVIL